MRILNIRPGYEDNDIAIGRKVIQQEIDQESKNVLLILGNTPEISYFADRCDQRSKVFGWRETVWIQDIRIPENWTLKLFGDEPHYHCGVVLDFRDQPIVHLTVDASLTDIEKAFLRAQGGTF